MLFLFIAYLQAQTQIIPEEALILQTATDPHTYAFFTNSVFLNDPIAAFMHLQASPKSSDSYALIYAHSSYFSLNLACNYLEVAALYMLIAEKVFERYSDSKVKSAMARKKRLFRDLKEDNRLYDTVSHLVNLINSGDRKAEDAFLKLVEQGRVEAAEHLRLLKSMAERGNPRAMGVLGEIYYEGRGVQRCYNTALHYFMEGANKRDALCYNGLGLVTMTEELKDLVSARRYFEEASKRGLAEADFNLYKFFRDVYKAEEIGMAYLLNASDKGYLPAIFTYAKKLYGTKKAKEAIPYLCAIADYSEDLLKIEELAEQAFLQGKSRESLMFLLLGSEMGSTCCIKNALYLLNTPGLIKQQGNIIFRLNEQLALMGNRDNIVRLGDCYFSGVGVKESKEDAFAFYLSACIFKEPEGFYSLSYMYEYGMGCKRSLIKALVYLFEVYERDRSAYLVVWYVGVKLVVKLILHVIYCLRVLIGTALGCILGYYALRRVGYMEK